ncbi:unnamed protein product [Linum tenue]|uniref:Uncharacterized protein n=1 Tax=Linum tenue TaxID=586396 RepID=A0AAV0HX47_9ROSI|nr:unnamed protein product [Linum tenue]
MISLLLGILSVRFRVLCSRSCRNFRIRLIFILLGILSVRFRVLCSLLSFGTLCQIRNCH